MHDSFHRHKFSVGQALAHLRRRHRHLGCKELGQALHTSHSTYLKIERDERDLSFVMALRVCQVYDMDIHDLIAMIDDAELERKDLSSLKMQIKREKKNAAALKADTSVIDK
jgi:plasmid maintenance system antidote protein VapI